MNLQRNAMWLCFDASTDLLSGPSRVTSRAILICRRGKEVCRLRVFAEGLPLDAGQAMWPGAIALGLALDALFATERRFVALLLLSRGLRLAQRPARGCAGRTDRWLRDPIHGARLNCGEFALIR